MKVCPRCRLKYPNEDDRCFVDGITLEPLADERIGKTIAGKYLVEQPIGEGGMAIVYRARHVLVDRPVAVKILGGHVSSQLAMKERFRREAKNAASLAHPNIIEIYDHGETDDGAPFMVMELLEGHPLSDLIARGPMSADDAASFGLQIAQGLSRAHDFDVIHRDLKPDNVFVSTSGGRMIAKLLDFGIARSMHDTRLTNAGEIFGTPQYMAPERITSIDAGAPADLYALGVMLFEMLTGKLPFHSESIAGFFLAHLQEPPPRPSSIVPTVPRRLEELILKLLAKSPEERPVDAHQVIKELAVLVPQGAGALVAPPPATVRTVQAPTLPPTTLERWARRTALFEAMAQRAYPTGMPADQHAVLEQIRAGLRRIHEVRSEGLREQRKLDALEQEARETRARLGHAAQSLAQDLSQARETQRAAAAEVEPYFVADRHAEAAYRDAYRALSEFGPVGTAPAPSEQVAGALRLVTEAYDRWLLAHSTAVKARAWLDGRSNEVNDLEYQVRMLRGQLEQIESDYTHKRAASERILVEGTREAEAREQALLQLAARFCSALRARPDLVDLFQRLEIEGA